MSTDVEQINACHDAIDALRQVLGELTGRCDPDPAALGNLRAAVAIIGQDAPATLDDNVVVEDSYCRRLTVTADLRPLGRGHHLFPVILVEDDWEAEDEDTWRELGSSIPLDPDQAERLGHALLAAAAAARIALTD